MSHESPNLPFEIESSAAPEVLLARKALLDAQNELQQEKNLLDEHLVRYARISARVQLAQQLYQSALQVDYPRDEVESPAQSKKRSFAPTPPSLEPSLPDPVRELSTSKKAKRVYAPVEDDEQEPPVPVPVRESKSASSAPKKANPARTFVGVCESQCVLPNCDARARLSRLLQERARLRENCAALTGEPVAKMRALLSYVRALDMGESPAPELTLALHLGAALRAAFGEAYQQIVDAACAAVPEKERKPRHPERLLFDNDGVGRLLRFEKATSNSSNGNATVNALFEGVEGAAPKVSFEVAFYSGIIDASLLSLTSATRATETERNAARRASARWLLALRGQV